MKSYHKARKKIKPRFEESNTENLMRAHFVVECLVFRSGQALGGHRRLLLLNNSTTTATTIANSEKFQNGVIDLNLPTPPEEFSFSQSTPHEFHMQSS